MKNCEQLYHGGEIYTVDESNPSAEALAVRDGIIIAVGNMSDCQSALGDSPTMINLNGSILLPGFIDTHLHPTMMTFFELNFDLSKVNSMRDLQAAVRDKAQHDSTSNWIFGLQFDEQTFDSPKLPTRHDLDQACPDRPVMILRKDGHSVIANTLAIETANITKSTLAPAGGIIEREANGYPSGAFRETAVSLLLQVMPFPEMQTIEQAGVTAFQKVIQQGITSVGMILQTGEDGIAGPQGAFDIPLMELLLDKIPINLYSLLVSGDVSEIDTHKKSALHQRQGILERRIGGMKFWGDGTFSSCTAFMNQPFSDSPNSKGFLIHSQEEMYRRMVNAHTAGEQIAIHSIGDACSRVCVNLFDRLLKEHPDNNHRHRLEHASLLNAQLIEDIARLNLIVANDCEITDIHFFRGARQI